MLDCIVHYHSAQRHLQQVFTGFSLLRRAGAIRLRQRPSPCTLYDASRPFHLRDAREAVLGAVVNGTIKIAYDVHDSFEIDPGFRAWADFYFKRSYSRHHIERLGGPGARVVPLGLNYLVYPDGIDWLGLGRSVRLGRRAGGGWVGALRSLKLLDLAHFVPRVGDMWQMPDVDARPRVLFLARAWDPHEDAGASNQVVEERRRINDTRAACIDALRGEFGPDFCGGFSPTDFAVRNYPHQLAPQGAMTAKKNYVRLLADFPICVATAGLNGSIGWKFAEYVAFAKAIVAERMSYEGCGSLAEGSNYLAFSTPDECVGKVRQLFVDDELRRELMLNNARYYQCWLRPDALVLNSLLHALKNYDPAPSVATPAHVGVAADA